MMKYSSHVLPISLKEQCTKVANDFDTLEYRGFLLPSVVICNPVNTPLNLSRKSTDLGASAAQGEGL